MTRRRQFEALQKLHEAEEREALADRAAAERVLVERQNRVAKVAGQIAALDAELAELQRHLGVDLAERRRTEVRIGRLRGERQNLAPLLAEAEQELMRAGARVELHENQAGAARVEKLKLETLLGRDRRRELIEKFQREEVEADEFAGVKPEGRK